MDNDIEQLDFIDPVPCSYAYSDDHKKVRFDLYQKQQKRINRED